MFQSVAKKTRFSQANALLFCNFRQPCLGVRFDFKYTFNNRIGSSQRGLHILLVGRRSQPIGKLFDSQSRQRATDTDKRRRHNRKTSTSLSGLSRTIYLAQPKPTCDLEGKRLPGNHKVNQPTHHAKSTDLAAVVRHGGVHANYETDLG